MVIAGSLASLVVDQSSLRAGSALIRCMHTIGQTAFLPPTALHILSSDPRATAWWLISIGVTSLGLVIRPAIQGFRMRHPRALALRVLILRFGLSAICYAGVASVGVIFGRRNLESGLTGLLVVVVVLLAIAVRNTWDLLVTVADKPEASPSRGPRSANAGEK